MNKKDLQIIKDTLKQCGYDRVVSGAESTFFCFGDLRNKPKVGVYLYQDDAIYMQKNTLVLKGTHENIR